MQGWSTSNVIKNILSISNVINNILLDVKPLINSDLVVAGDFRATPSPIDRSLQRKQNKQNHLS